MSQKNPKVSIVMPVRNAGSFVMEAVQSIQDQTFCNWELIIVDDASTDNTPNIIKNLADEDKRIRILRNIERMGPSESANIAISKAGGEFIARMDADDVSLPNRLNSQIKFLLENKKAVAVGGQCIVIDKTGKEIGKKMFPVEARDIKSMIFISVPLQQPTLMVSKSLLPKNFFWYEGALDVAEEVDLLFRLFKYGDICNLPEFVLRYRIHGENTSLKNPKRTFLLTLKTRARAVFKYGYKPTFKGLFMTWMQFMVVLLLPNRLIYPTYALLRGIVSIRPPFGPRFVISKDI